MTRFLADENVSRLVVERLGAAGFDVTSISATGSGASDNEVLATAIDEGRILITEDRDFGELVVRQRVGVRGVASWNSIVCRMRRKRTSWRRSLALIPTNFPGT